MECAALAGLGLDPDAAAVALDHLLADGEANARSRVLALVMQALEHHEDALEVRRFDANAIVGHDYLPFIFFLGTRDVDAGHRCRAKLEGVADQVLEELGYLRVVALHD